VQCSAGCHGNYIRRKAKFQVSWHGSTALHCTALHRVIKAKQDINMCTESQSESKINIDAVKKKKSLIYGGNLRGGIF
jgi:hypothetical protein